MDTERLRAFQAVAAERSFSRAAHRLHKTQPAVSQAVAALEAELGERLFHRRGRQVELTQAGAVLLEHVGRAFAELEQGRAKIQALAGLTTGRLRIGTSDTTACYVLPPVLRAFRERYPGVEIVISNRPSPITVRQVLDREVDLGIVTLPVRESGVEVVELLAREDVLICPPKHLLARKRLVRLTDLEGEPLLLLDRGSRTRSFIDRKLREAGVEPHVVMELASIEVIKKLVALGFGVSIVPRVAVRQEVREGALRAIRLFPPDEARKLGAVYAAKGGPTPAAREFLRDLERRLGAGVGHHRTRHHVGGNDDAQDVTTAAG